MASEEETPPVNHFHPLKESDGKRGPARNDISFNIFSWFLSFLFRFSSVVPEALEKHSLEPIKDIN